MANSLGTSVDRYTQLLDGILEAGPLTNDLNMNGNLVGELSGAGQIKIAKLGLQGLADHTRGGGFTTGAINLDWETVTLAYDRDRAFSIDAMDDDEREMIVTANVMGEFARTEVVPEVDAIRFAKLAAGAGTIGTPTTFSTADAAKAELLTAEEAIEDFGGVLGDCLLYVSPAYKKLLRMAVPYEFESGVDPNTTFQTFDGMKIVTVPSTRFYTAIELLDGKTVGEEAGGYTAAATGKGINFMLVNPACASAITKHEKLRYFAPDTNQTDDAHLWQYRLYHDLFVYANKADMIYLSNQA